MNAVFEQCSLGPLRLKNRIIRSATHEGMALANGMPSEGLAGLYERIAEGGAGAIITGYVGVMQNGRTFANMRMFDNDAFIDVYRVITDRLRRHGTPIIAQLAHGGSKSRSALSGQDVISPSAQTRNDYGDACREASEEEIEAIIDSFVAAIVRARQAGFDGVQLHAAHGYLLSEFISPHLNRRRDKWGGSMEHRLRIVREIIERARQVVGPFPILVKLSTHEERREGITENDAVAIAQLLRKSSCDAIEVSCGYGDFLYAVRMQKVPSEAILRLAPGYRELPALQKHFLKIAMGLRRMPRPLHNYNVEAAERIRRAVDIPVIAVGGIRNIKDITDIVARRNIDFVSLSRPFIIEPDIVKKFQSGSQDQSRCIDCGYCLIGVTDGPVKCYYGRLPRP